MLYTETNHYNKSSIYLKQFSFKTLSYSSHRKKQETETIKEQSGVLQIFLFVFNTVMALFKTQLHKSINFKVFKEILEELNTLYTYCHTKSIKIGPKTSTKYKTHPYLFA